MRLLTGFALVLVGIAIVQSQLVIPQFNNLNAVISLLPQLQGFIGQLDNILPQLAGVLSSSELQSLKDKVLQLVLSQVGDINGLKDKLQGLFQQILGSKPLGRIDLDAIIQQIINTTATALPGFILGLIGKREATDARVDIMELLALVDKYQLSSFIPNIEQFLGADKLQQLQNQLLATVVTALGNNWNAATIAQAIQQLVTQFVPQAAQMRIDWEGLGQQVLTGLAGALPGVLLGALFGKREATDARVNIMELLALADKYQLSSFIPNIEQFLSADKLQELQNQFLATVVTALSDNWNSATIAQAIQQLVTQFVPQAAQMRIDWEGLGQQVLTGIAGALPGVLLGALFGKREATDARVNIMELLALVDKYQLSSFIPNIEQFLSADKLQELQNQFLATVVTALSDNWNSATIAQAIQQLVTQFVPQAAQMRIDWEGLGQQVLTGIAGALPGVLLGALFGKREATDARVNIMELLALVDKYQLSSFIPNIEQFLSADKLQELQNQFLATVVTALSDNWNSATIAQAIQQLVTQFVPQAAQMRIDWEGLGQQVLTGIAGALPGVLLGALFGKREATDARVNIMELLALVDKYQLSSFIPNIEQFLSADKLQELQNQFLATVVTALSDNWNSATIAQAIQQLVTQFVPQAAQMRIDWEGLGQQVLTGIAGALPGVLLGALFGKREATDARVNIMELLALVDKYQLSSFIPNIEQFLGADKLQELQNQLLATVVTALGNNWNAATIAQAIQQLVTQFVPQAAQMRIDWEGLGQTALNGLASALPGLLLGALFGKRDLAINDQQLLAQLPVKNLAQLLQIVNNVDKSKLTTVLAKVKELLQSFFPAYRGRINFDDLAAAVLSHLNSLLPILGQSLLSTVFG